MDLHSVKELLHPYVTLAMALFANGFLSSGLTSLLKTDSIAIPAATHPRTVAGVLAVVGTLVALWLTDVNVALTSVWSWLAFAGASLVVSAWTYNNLWRGLTKKDGKSAA